MEGIQILISDIPDPVFIINSDRQIVLANEKADSGFNSPVGKIFEDVVITEEFIPNVSITFYNNRWFDLKKDFFVWKDQTLQKVVLKKRRQVPDPDSLETLRSMTAILLHHFRSPLTGMQGYLQLLEKKQQQTSFQKFKRIWSRGFKQLFDLMDELENLYNIPLLEKGQVFHVQIPVIVQEVIAGYPQKTRSRLLFKKPTDPPSVFKGNSLFIKKVLSILIDNAIEHSTAEQDNITIEILKSNTIRVSNTGVVIPQDVADKMFFPFVTGKAHNLGVGLTKALLYANQCGATISLTENCPKKGVSLTLHLPPCEVI